jgi:hypothetical protein
MFIRRPVLAWFLVLIGVLVTMPAPGQEKKDVKDTKPATESKEVVLSGTLTSLEQEVAHALTLKKDQAYLITVTSRGFFTAFRVEDEFKNKLALASGSSTTLKAPADGLFRLLVYSPGGSSGQYVVTVRTINLTPTKPGEVLTVGKDGITVEAILSKEDPFDKVRKKHCKTYDVQMKAGKTYVIDMISKQLDSYLRLEDAAGKKLAQDDDSGGGTNARIRFKAPSEGVYRVYATSFGLETGLFLLKIREE